MGRRKIREQRNRYCKKIYIQKEILILVSETA
jgi:hypothetical protein